MIRKRWWTFAAWACLACPVCPAPAAGTVEESIDAVRVAGSVDGGFQAAAESAGHLRRSLTGDDLPKLLDAMRDVDPVAENWLRGIITDVARKAEGLPTESLADYAMDRSNNPIGRGMAMELVRTETPEQATKLIDQCLDDPSLPLREMAVEQAIDKARSAAAGDKSSAIAIYQAALTNARQPKQLQTIVEALNKLGESVSLGGAFAMITDWQAVGPFDNVDGVGFAAVYPPEQQFASSAVVDLAAKPEGKHGVVSWKEVKGSDDDGKVDLAKAFDKEKGAVAYLYTEFDSPSEQAVQVRLSCITANKVWINGREVMANEVYHSGSAIDQYTADAKLRAGTNTILLKICQNEQTESWAQEWEFQFRLTDPNGKALTSE